MKWSELAVDLAGLACLILFSIGAGMVFGKGYGLMAAGGPPFLFYALYVWQNVAVMRGRRRRP